MRTLLKVGAAAAAHKESVPSEHCAGAGVTALGRRQVIRHAAVGVAGRGEHAQAHRAGVDGVAVVDVDVCARAAVAADDGLDSWPQGLQQAGQPGAWVGRGRVGGASMPPSGVATQAFAISIQSWGRPSLVRGLAVRVLRKGHTLILPLPVM